MSNPPETAVDLMKLVRDWSADAPDEVTTAVNLTSAPPLPVIPEEWHGKKVAVFVAVTAGPLEEADAKMKAFREVGEPIADLLGPMPYTVIQSLLDPLWPKGIQAYFKGTNLTRLDDALIERLAEQHLAAPGPQAASSSAPPGWPSCSVIPTGPIPPSTSPAPTARGRWRGW